MGKSYVLYNPLAGAGEGEKRARELAARLPDRTPVYRDITKIKDFTPFLAQLSPEDTILVCGGDGTVSRFANDIYGRGVQNGIFYYATGQGNDFLRDLGQQDGADPIRINEVIARLPSVTVNGKTTRFLNGIGFGIDGYCCEVGDQKRLQGKKANYTAIAIRGLLYGYRPADADVTVDGQAKHYKKVWICPTMLGRYYGGGMMPAPQQRRDDPQGRVSVAVIHGAGKLRTLTVFPSIFSGEHVRHTEMVEVLCGRRISVRFDRPAPLQIDGETVSGVLGYDVDCSD